MIKIAEPYGPAQDFSIDFPSLVRKSGNKGLPNVPYLERFSIELLSITNGIARLLTAGGGVGLGLSLTNPKPLRHLKLD